MFPRENLFLCIILIIFLFSQNLQIFFFLIQKEFKNKLNHSSTLSTLYSINNALKQFLSRKRSNFEPRFFLHFGKKDEFAFKLVR